MATASSLVPRLSAPALLSSSRFTAIYAQRLSIPFLPAFSLAVPSSIQLSLPALPSPLSVLQDLWEGILRAVPKKKTSHSKKRHRQMAGKALKDMTSLCKCPACGRLKRMHYLCPFCMSCKWAIKPPGDTC